MYRKRTRGSRKFNERMARAREAKARRRMEGEPPDYGPDLPELRRRMVIEDFDFGEVRHEFCLYRTSRIDVYRVEVDGQEVGRMGWAKTLEMARKGFVRVQSER